jgi:hypothetical protein
MPFKDLGMTKQVKNYINSLDWWHYKDDIKKGFVDWQKGIKHENSKEGKQKKENESEQLGLF